MKRYGNIIQEIVQYHNMSNAFDTVLRGTKRKRSPIGRYLIRHREQVIEDLIASILAGIPEKINYHDKMIVEGAKPRKIQIISMRSRIKACAVMTVVDDYLKRTFIRTTSASIKGRGVHDLLAYIRSDIERVPSETRFCYKFDVRKFYESVNQDTVMECVRRVFKDELLIAILDKFVRLMPQGLSIGLRSSQGLGNLLLSIHLDHVLKDKLGVKHYYRYCDDGVVLAETKEDLWQIRDVIHKQVASIGLSIKPDERVFPITEGIDFLGYVIYPDHVRLRKRNKQNAARKLNKLKSKRRRCEVIASLYGMAKHADCNRLFNKLTNKDMRSFRDLNVAYQPKDGKKRFAGYVVSLRDIVNLPVIIKDYELGIKTTQGDDRCVVSVEHNGELKKFITNSEEMKGVLEQVSELEQGFPFETVIRAEVFGKGKIKYMFS